ncbi:MAG TPA: iron-sulfur cluster assembly scaffold protein [Candidatus Absconditabacterales bacterium]|nr:iron-sulfur cluster assembly scaffold protein [Candidatus Absconditabacterales bacterium]
MSEEQNIMIQEYAKNPLQNFALKEYTIKQHEGNFICGDDIVVYLEITNNIIKNYSFDGNCSNISTAAASFLSEFIIGKSIKDVLQRNYQTMVDHGFEVSPRRKRAAVIAILATRNAIHTYTKDGKNDTFDDLIED